MKDIIKQLDFADAMLAREPRQNVDTQARQVLHELLKIQKTIVDMISQQADKTCVCDCKCKNDTDNKPNSVIKHGTEATIIEDAPKKPEAPKKVEEKVPPVKLEVKKEEKIEVKKEDVKAPAKPTEEQTENSKKKPAPGSK